MLHHGSYGAIQVLVDHFLVLFGCAYIHLNPRVLKWIGVELN